VLPKGFNYKRVTVHGHHRADPQGHVLDHVLVAEAALGKALPAGAEVHHVDENTLNNAGRNLVICQDRAYHKLLHARTRIVKAGGNPNTERVCSRCKSVLAVAAFNRLKADYQTACRACQKLYFAEFWKRKRGIAA
jgi:hypothetical protein